MMWGHFEPNKLQQILTQMKIFIHNTIDVYVISSIIVLGHPEVMWST